MKKMSTGAELNANGSLDDSNVNSVPNKDAEKLTFDEAAKSAHRPSQENTSTQNEAEPKTNDDGLVLIKRELEKHELSAEQQLYYMNITKACMGPNEKLRQSALQSLAWDPAICAMLPQLSVFIADGVKVNVVEENVTILEFFMRMIRALLENKTLYINPYLHKLVPAVITCIVCKRLSKVPDNEKHWVLRENAAELIASICTEYSNPINDIQPRLISLLSKVMLDDKTNLFTLYGTVTGLMHLGSKVVQENIIPHLKVISQRIDPLIEFSKRPMIESQIAIDRIQGIIEKGCPRVLEKMRPPPDDPNEYRKDYGLIGTILCESVMALRVSSFPVQSLNTPSGTVAAATSAAKQFSEDKFDKT